jgi:membrane protease YdiL (CAAX protease family)
MIRQPAEQFVKTPSPALQTTFEERISRVRLWTLLLVLFVPLVAWTQLSQRLGVSSDVSRIVSDLLYTGLPFVWWLLRAAPQPCSVQATMGRSLNLAGWGVVAVALFGATCLQFIGLLAPKWAEIVNAFSSGGAFSFGDTSVLPEFFRTFTAVVLGPITEELIFRGTFFRKWRVRWGPGKAALLSSAIFAAIHTDVAGVFLGGLTYALVYTRARSLWAALAMHVLHNGMLRGLFALSYLWGRPKLIHLDSPWEYGVLALVLLSGVGVWVRFVLKSWRTLGDPLPPDSLQAAPPVSSSILPELTRVGS